MKQILLTLTASCLFLTLTAQVVESFTDGNFTSHPVWSGTPASWQVTTTGQLQSTQATTNTSFYLSTPSTLATETEWNVTVRLAFNTSSANYTDIFLTASAADLTLPGTTGYFVRIGNTQDEVSLYRKESGGMITKLIDGIDGVTNSSDNTLQIKVVRDAQHSFTLYRDNTGTGNSLVMEGTARDTVFLKGAYFGILVRQSTASFVGKHFFDELSVQPYRPDRTPPAITSLQVVAANQLEIHFSEPVTKTTIGTIAAYEIDNGIGQPLLAQPDAGDPSRVSLAFSRPFVNGYRHTLSVTGVMDEVGNKAGLLTASFRFYTAQRYDVVITEIMADPTPAVGLPVAEYVELKNRSREPLNVQGWRLSTASATSGAFPAYTLLPDSLVLLTTTGNAALLAGYGPVLAIPSFPSLDNEGTVLALRSKEGVTIHAVAYTADWYANPVKREGGWSLELKDIQHACGGKGHWTASTDANGGTPGRTNSVAGTVTDIVPPVLLHSYLRGADTIVLVFSAPLDSLQATVPGSYTVQPAIAVKAIQTAAPLFTTVELILAAPLPGGIVYTVTVVNGVDCQGHTITGSSTVKAGRPEAATPQNLVINEILFNPKTGGEDYVELYNRGTGIYDLQQLFLANRLATGTGTPQRLATAPYYLFPGEYAVFTTSKTLDKDYFLKTLEAVHWVAALPSLPDDKGIVVLLNNQGAIIDEVAYKESWQFPLLATREGVALERLNPDGPSSLAANWHSAASAAGYGTPGYQNSQYIPATIEGQLTVTPLVFSPDNDGYNDVVTIHYETEAPGYTGRVVIYDAAGRLVRTLVAAELLGRKGDWVWDGLDDRQRALPQGPYLFYIELLNLEGRRQRLKKTVVLARKKG